jgi:hypothetical protein
VNFLRDCLSEQVTPASIKVHQTLDGNPFSTSAFCALNDAIELEKFNKESAFFKCRHRLRALKSFLIDRHWISKLEDFAFKTAKEKAEEHKKKLAFKLANLCKLSPWAKFSLTSAVTNLSKHILTKTQSELLGFGLSFSTGPNKNFLINCLNSVGNFAFKFGNLDFLQGSIFPTLINNFREAPFLPKRYRLALQELSKLKDIHITKSDKGGGVVIMDRSDYEQKMFELFSDVNVYKKLKTNPLESIRNAFNKGLTALSNRLPDPSFLLKFKQFNPTLPYAYGLPKIHKINNPLRPIISGIGSSPHRLAGFLANLLSPLLGSFSNSHLKHSSDLIDRLKSFNPAGHKLISFDVESLFTNVPLDVVLDFLQRKLLNSNHDFPLPIDVILDGIRLCVSNNCFVFNGNFYKQIFGIAMGSPLSPILANLFLEMIETEFLPTYNKPLPSLWLRYVDDVLALVPDNFDTLDFLAHINSFFPTLKFTFECEINNSIPFLDVMIHRFDSYFKFNVYRKPTNSNLYLHYFSYHSAEVKKSVAHGLYLRALRICDNEFLQPEFKTITKHLSDLGYPKFVLNKALYSAKRTFGNLSIREKESDCKLLVLPFHKNLENNKKMFRDLNVEIAFKNHNKLGSLLVKNKSCSPDVKIGTYVIPCTKCDNCYIGETGNVKGLKARFQQHKNDVINFKTKLSSGPAVHYAKSKHLLDFNSGELVFASTDRNKRRLVESALINKFSNINLNEGFKINNNCINSLILKNVKIPNCLHQKSDLKVT